MGNEETTAAEYEISSDPGRLDLDWVHEAISTDTYWGTGRTRERMERAVENSIPYGLYGDEGRQLAFARLVTDRTTFAWLSDVFVHRDARGKGLGKRLIEHVVAEADAMGVKRVLLATADAEELYRQFGFTEIGGDFSWMYKVWPDRV